MLRDHAGEPRGPSLAVLGGEASKEKLLLAEEIAGAHGRTFVAGQLVASLSDRQGIYCRSNAAVTEEMVSIAERMMRGGAPAQAHAAHAGRFYRG